MIQANSVEKRSVHFRILTDDQVWRIKRAALDIMQTVGFKVLHEEARKMLKSAGAWGKGEIVKVPEHIVNECLMTAPKGWTIFNREGKRAMEVEGTNSYYGTATAAPNTRDALTGEVHETRVADIALGAKVADALENIDWVMPMGSSQDVDSTAADVHEFEAVVTNTTKPIIFIGYTPRGTELVYEMAAEVAGGLDNLRERPFLILYPEPISPLVVPADVIDRLFVAADLFMPQMMGPAVQPGATGPVTLAGAIVQSVAESLMCVVLAQLRKPNCPCGLGVNFPILDMATTLMCVAAPEVSLALCAQAEVAQSFGLPSWGLAGCTDSKVIDAQAGIESAFSILAQGLGGLNLIHDVGYMDSGMIVSAEQLVLGNEIINMAKRFIKGIEVNQETLAREVIEQVGPGGHYLEHDHTLKHFKDELWHPKLLTRQSRIAWEESGSKDMSQRIKEELRKIVETHKIPLLPDKTLAALEKIKKDRDKEIAEAKTGKK